MGALEKSTSLFSLDQNGVENSSVHSGSLDDNFEDNGSLAAFGGKVRKKSENKNRLTFGQCLTKKRKCQD